VHLILASRLVHLAWRLDDFVAEYTDNTVPGEKSFTLPEQKEPHW
jgi:hypothetical protein